MQKLLAWCGITGPIVFTSVMLILGFIRPGYNHATHIISELGETGTPNAAIMNAIGFPSLGLSLIALAFGLHKSIGEGKGSKVGPFLLGLAGSLWALLGLFHRDPTGGSRSSSGLMHNAIGTVFGIAVAFALLATALRARHDHRWKAYSTYSLAAGVMSIFSGFIFMTPIERRKGLVQKGLMGAILLVWMEVVSFRLLRLSARMDCSHDH